MLRMKNSYERLTKRDNVKNIYMIDWKYCNNNLKKREIGWEYNFLSISMSKSQINNNRRENNEKSSIHEKKEG